MAPEAEEATEEEGGLRSQMWKHEAMVEWINSADDVDLDTLSAAEVIAYAFARRVAWRKSDLYKNLVASHAAEAETERAERAKAREEAAATRKAEKEAAAAAKAAKEAEAKEGKEPAKAAKAAKATKATKKTTGGKGAAAGEDSPFS